jgi:energy-coupling factor transporter transmembrane protein EcfT
MDARGFAARDSRTSIVELRLTRVDRFIMYTLLVASLVAVVLRLLGIGLITRNYL